MTAFPGEVALRVETNGGQAKWLERRKRVRMRVSWRVCFVGRGSAEIHDTFTRDLSCDGLQCQVKAPFAVGELAMCTLWVPTNDQRDASRTQLVNCKVRIVWVESKDEGFQRIGCRIENYRFSTDPDPRSPWQS